MPRPSVEVERREQILTATRAVITEKGFKATRIADVARLSKISTGTIHYYFETKRDLIRATFEWNFELSQARRAPLMASSEDPRNRLNDFLDSYLPLDPDVTESWHLWLALWSEALHDPELQELNERAYGEWRRTVAAIIEEGQDEGVFVAGDPTLLANALVGMVDGLALQVLLQSPSMTMARMHEVCSHAIDLMLADNG